MGIGGGVYCLGIVGAGVGWEGAFVGVNMTADVGHTGALGAVLGSTCCMGV